MLFLASLGIVVSVLEGTPLQVDASRVLKDRVVSAQLTEEDFGVLDLIPDKRPAGSSSHWEASETWQEVRAGILDRLGDVRSGSAENFCWVSHEEVLDEQGVIVKGGLVAVVQKQVSFRINFYRMQEFRNWVRVKKLDIGSNKKFEDETDVWVVRLIDETEESKRVLPKLDKTSSRRGSIGNTIAPELLERAERVRSIDFVSDFPTPRAGEETLIPSLVTQGREQLAFKFFDASSEYRNIFRRKNSWRWDLMRAHFGGGIRNTSFAGGLRGEQGRTVFKAESDRFSFEPVWVVSDAQDRALFTLRPYAHGTEYKLFCSSSSDALFTIRMHFNAGMLSTPLERVYVLKGDGADDDVLYFGQNVGPSRPVLMFYNGPRSGSGRQVDRLPVAMAPYSYSVESMNIYASADTALLLVASALASRAL
eukprot:TRINITY_DN6655_c0_g1_i1.p1 TRINITY_DN6655_c0_g1~~TRINITY_DN6655_c0_g1_i1.p1  ORF type:complete len:422 (+),score=33.41 TRINITY_DN6655_c0_g1_i1:73-1338(+)